MPTTLPADAGSPKTFHDPEAEHALRSAVVGQVSLLVVGDDGQLLAKLAKKRDVLIVNGDAVRKRYGTGAFMAVPKNCRADAILRLRIRRRDWAARHHSCLENTGCVEVIAPPRRVKRTAYDNAPLALSTEVELAIAALAEFTARARSVVRGNDLPTIDPAAPLASALGRIAVGAALVDARLNPTLNDLGAARRVAVDSIPAVRAQLLNLADDRSAMPPRLFKRTSEELSMLGLMESNGCLTKLSEELLLASGIKR